MSLPLHAQTRPVPEAAVLEGLPPVRDVPVLTSWTVDDLRWALRQDSAVFFVLTNTRSLSPEGAATRNREVVRALHAASAAEGTGYVLAGRGDSTLRGHFPLETDVLAAELTELGAGAPDGVVLVPAYIETRRAHGRPRETGRLSGRRCWVSGCASRVRCPASG